MKNYEVFQKDPRTSALVNNGVARVSDAGSEQELATLRYELETFVCEGEYERGLDRILSSYLENLAKPEQPAFWVSGFYGSGKSHLVKVLRHLWVDTSFPDGATARGITRLPSEIADHFRELDTAARRAGGVRAAAGTLGAGAGESVRLALLGIVFHAVGLPENYAQAMYLLEMKRQGILDAVRNAVAAKGKKFDRELQHMYVSPVLAQAILDANPDFARSPADVKVLLKEQFPQKTDVSNDEMFAALTEALVTDDEYPLTLIVLDEVQQYIGTSTERSYQVQEVAEECCKRFGARLLFVGTGQNALTGTPQLQRLQARFSRPIQLSDTDVETVIRRIVLAKRADKEQAVKQVLEEHSGEISRQLQGTALGPQTEDRKVLVTDYPLLPVRHRFWERVLRAVDPAGTASQLRTQLHIVHEAVKDSAGEPLGTVIPADYVFDKKRDELVQTGMLMREIEERIKELDDGSSKGRLKARICATVFLINALPREGGADTGVRASADRIADLLVSDLRGGSAELRREVPLLLEQLAGEGGYLMPVDGEYRLQTPEGSEWEKEYQRRYAKIFNDDQRIASERADRLRRISEDRLGGMKLPHGDSKIQRKLRLAFGGDKPSSASGEIPVWIRDEWTDDPKSVTADARAAGSGDATIHVFIPKHAADALKKQLAAVNAARETLEARGVPSSEGGHEAQRSMETRQRANEDHLANTLNEIMGGAKVMLSGASEVTGSSLTDTVKEAAESALRRLYPEFATGDDARWSRVIERVKKGSGSALEAVDHKGDADTHPVCSAVRSEVGTGMKGSSVRKKFASPPYGWPQDAIDAALLVLVQSGHLSAKRDHKPVTHKELDQSKIGVADFRTETKVLTVAQRIALRGLFLKAGVKAVSEEEAAGAALYLERLRSLAAAAGGEPPRPSSPRTTELDDLASLAGNDQLLEIYEQREQLEALRADWTAAAERAAARMPRWNSVEQMAEYARALSGAADTITQVQAVLDNRKLLDDPDPVAPLADALCGLLRNKLQDAATRYADAHEEGMQRLGDAAEWKKLEKAQRDTLLRERGLSDDTVGQGGHGGGRDCSAQTVVPE